MQPNRDLEVDIDGPDVGAIQSSSNGHSAGEEESGVENYTTDGELSPFHRLPAEILSVIFEWVVDIQCQELLHPTLRSKWWTTFPALNTTRKTLIPPQYWSPVEYWIDLIFVCRYWRNIALSTPRLWTRINLNERAVSRDETMFMKNAWAQVSLERSGTLPLALYCTTTPTSLTVPHIYRHRVRELFLHNTVTGERAQELLASCPSLSVLVVYNDCHPAGLPITAKNKAWESSNLETLLSYRCSFWQYGTFGNLRHLVIEGESFTFPSGITTLFKVLSHTPHLEDLVLLAVAVPSSQVFGPRDTQEYARHHIPIVHMPSLRRMKIIERKLPVITWLLDRNIVCPEDVARSFTVIDPSERDLLNPSSPLADWSTNNPHPVERLHVSSDDVFATNGTSATHFSIAGATQRKFFFSAFMPFFESQTQELWLSLSINDIAVWADILARLHSVKTLVLYGRHGIVETSLGLFSLPYRFFPSLTTLQVHFPNPYCLPRYIFTLESRRQSGHQIKTLRLVGANDAWRNDETRQAFEKVVNSVVFLDEAASKFQLPTICTTDSPVHAYWTGWTV